jgi:oxygen-independent coproporphyrinogen III oxidase
MQINVLLGGVGILCSMNTPIASDLYSREPAIHRLRHKVLFDIPLLRRHDPRASEHAGSPHLAALSSGFGEADYRAHAARSNGDLIPRHLSLYLHIPHCVNRDVHCSADCTVTQDLRRPRCYIESLRREIAAVGRLFDRDREVLDLHLGGGTPNLLGCSDLADLMDSLARHFRFGPAPQRSFSIALDPRLVHDSDLAAYAALGFNQARLSTTVDAINGIDSSSRPSSRNRPLDRLLGAIDSCHANGFGSVALDVVYDAAGQSLTSFQRLLDLVLTARPDQLVFSRAARQGELRPKPQGAGEPRHFELLMVAAERLAAAGYEYLGLDNFVLANHGLLRAQRTGTLGSRTDGYTMHGDCDRVGVGVGATSYVGDCVSQNHADVSEWEKALDAGRLPVARGRALEFDDIVREDVIQQILCRGAVDIDATAQRYYIEFADHFAEALQKLQPMLAERVVESDGRSISVTATGRPMLHTIAACFI